MKKILCVLLVLTILVLGTFSLVACNEKEDVVTSVATFVKDINAVVTAPDFDSLFSESDLEVLNQAAAHNLDGDALKSAVMLAYNTANGSRINHDGVSLMLQRSLGGNEMGRVYMNGFTLQNGNEWYYQLPAQAAEGDVTGFEMIAKMMAPIAGNLQIAYTTGNDTYEYFYVMGSQTQIDCSSITTFPYSTYVIPSDQEPTKYDSKDALQADRNFRESQLELNNMGICADLIDECNIEHNDEEGYYTITFTIDCENSDEELLKEFQKYSKLDLDIGTFPIDNTIRGWKATLEVWDNGYAKYFFSEEVWEMVVTVIGIDFPVDSTPSNEFVYVWNSDEIVNIISQDEKTTDITSKALIKSDEEIISEVIREYTRIAQNDKTFVFDYFTFVIVLVSCVVGLLIITAIVLAILFKKGKLPKLAAAIERDKARRKAIVEQNKQDKQDKKDAKEERKEERAEKRAQKHSDCDNDQPTED